MHIFFNSKYFASLDVESQIGRNHRYEETFQKKKKERNLSFYKPLLSKSYLPLKIFSERDRLGVWD